MESIAQLTADIRPARVVRVVVVAALAGIGFIACQYHSTYVLASLVIIAWGIAPSRQHAYLYVLTYSVFSTWVVVPAIVDYLLWHPAKAMGFWLISVLMTTLPWPLLYRKDTRCLELRLLLLLLITWTPPIGFVQFASPFVGSSLLMSGAGWWSIAMGLAITSAIIRGLQYHYTRSAFITSALLLTAGMSGHTDSIPGWRDVNTSVKVGGLVHTIEGSRDALSQVRQIALTDKPRVAVLGESTGGYSVDAGKTVLRNATRNTIVLAGGRVDEQQALFRWHGDDADTLYHQRVRPILLEHMDGALNGNKTVVVDGLRIAPLICYEGSVPYPLVSALADKPEAIVAIANFHWSRNDHYFERVLRAHISVWGRIFGIPTLVAVNRRGDENV